MTKLRSYNTTYLLKKICPQNLPPKFTIYKQAQIISILQQPNTREIT